MQSLIPVRQEMIGADRVNSVDARELYKVLEIKQEFTNWIKSQIDSLGLEENIDFISFDKKVKREKGATIRKQYILTIDIAKHIAMASRTQKGREVRRYFIEVERRYREKEQIKNRLSKEITYDTVIVNLSIEEIKKIEQEIKKYKKEIEKLKSKKEAYKKIVCINSSKTFQHYDKEELDRLITLKRNGASYKHIAFVLGRTPKAISSKIDKLKKEGIL